MGDGEHLEVEGERYGVVTSFCYLGDTIDGNGGASAAITTRIQSGWKKFNELAPFLTSRAPSLTMKGRVYNACVRSCLLYGSETWPMTAENEKRLKTADYRMTRKLCGSKLTDRNTLSDLQELTGIEDLSDSLRKRRLRWLGHVTRKDNTDWVKRSWKQWDVEGTRPPGRPKKTWESTVKEDCNLLGLDPEVAHNREEWKARIAARPTQKTGRGRKRR